MLRNYIKTAFKSLQKQKAYYFTNIPGLSVGIAVSILIMLLVPDEKSADKIVFFFIAFLILVITCVNFMNLSTARSATRAREVVIRKMAGASRKQLIFQFLAESVFFSLMALFLSLVLLELLMRPFNNYTGNDLDIAYFDKGYLIPALILGALLMGIFSGIYPAFYLSAFRVVDILKGRDYKGKRSTRLRGLLVVSQFTMATILLISSMVTSRQVRYFRGADLGFNKDNIVVVQRAYDLKDRKEAFKEELLNHPRINTASVSMELPGTGIEQYPFHINNTGKDRMVCFRTMRADGDFLSTMQMYLVAGDIYKGKDSMGYNSVLINETAAREMDVDNPVGMKLTGFGMRGEETEYTITGIVKDCHYESLRRKIEPLAITLLNEKERPKYLSVRISGEDMQRTVTFIEKAWKKYTNDETFDYYFLNEHLDAQYNKEETTAGTFVIFTFLAIFIAALGLFGLTSHTAEQKTREIGIRKVMGATIPGITLMLFTHFTRWVVWANLIAFPLAYLGMKLWLGKYAYHIHMEAWLFLLAAILVLAIALFTVSFQTVLSAGANPVKALRYE